VTNELAYYNAVLINYGGENIYDIDSRDSTGEFFIIYPSEAPFRGSTLG